MQRIACFAVIILFLFSCREKEEDPIDPVFFEGPFELVSNKFSLCPSEQAELMLFSFALNERVERIPASELVFEPIQKEHGSLSNNGIFKASNAISKTQIITLKARLKRKPTVQFSIPIELISPSMAEISFVLWKIKAESSFLK